MKGDGALYIDKTPVASIIDGLLRGLIRNIYVEENEKVADVDPRGIKEYCHSITDKARAIGGAASLRQSRNITPENNHYQRGHLKRSLSLKKK